MAVMGRRPKPAAERFDRQTRPGANECIEWAGFLDRDGYGQFRAGGRGSSKVRSHRWVYENAVGPIPEGFVLDHLCRNRSCVNPEHLEPVTPRENWLRGNGPARINADKTHCLRGHLLSPENTYTSGGARTCKQCHKAASAANYRKKRVA